MSKLVVNFQSIPGFGESLVGNSGMEYAFVIDPPETPVFPGAKVIGRTYMPDNEANALVAQGATGAEQWFNRWLPVYESRSYVYAWESPNEPHPMWESSFRVALKEFLIRWSELMHSRGWKTVGGCFSVGWPNVGDAKDIGSGLAACDFWSVHEYSAPAMWDSQTWLCLRYRRTVAELIAAGFPVRPLIITECGIDGGVISQEFARTGYKTFTVGNQDEKETQYMEQLAWYDGELMKDDYVMAAAIFVAGPNMDWMDFEVTETLGDKLTAYRLSHENPEPEPGPEVNKANGVDVSRWQGDINWDKVKAAGYSFAIIRASGPNDDKTAVVTDPYFVANYEHARSAGLLIGAYHGLQDGFAGQALLFVNSVGDRPLDLGYFADLEVSTLTDEKCLQHVNAVDARLIERFGWAEGKYCNIYTSPGFMSGRDTAFAEGRGLWLAHWTEDESDIIIPEPWDNWEFWQYKVGDAGTVDGISTRIDLDYFNGTEEELYDKYRPDDNNGGTDMELKIWGLAEDGVTYVEKDWDWVATRYGVKMVSADPPKGETVFRLTEIRQKVGPAGFTIKVVDEAGQPMKGVAVIQGWKDGNLLAPQDAPRISATVWGQPFGLPNNGGGGMTDVNGVYGWGWGSGEQYDPTGEWGEDKKVGPHWYWVLPGGNEVYSDVFAFIGWLLGTDHDTVTLTYTCTIADDGGDPVDPEEPTDGDLGEVVAELKRIAAALEGIAGKFPKWDVSYD